LKGRSKDLPSEIAALFRSFEPYEGGNNAIWALNRLCNHGKHKLLVPVGMATMEISQSGSATRGLRIPIPRWDSEKNEIVLLSTDAGEHLNYQCQIKFFIAFGEIEPVAGKPADRVLQIMAEEVERIVLATETEARKIGLIA
jgi:hypothetical protein